MKKIYFLPFFFFALAIQVLGQSKYYVFSPDSRYFASVQDTVIRSKYTKLIDIYRTATREWLYSLEAKDTVQSKNTKYGFSNDGELFYLINNRYALLWSMITGGMVNRHDNLLQIAFSHTKKFYLIADKSSMKAYDTYSGEQLAVYEIPATKQLDTIFITPDDLYIVAKTRDSQILIWKTLISKLAAKFQAQDIQINSKARIVILTNRKSDGSLELSILKLPELKIINEISTKNLIEKRRKQLQAKKAGDYQLSLQVDKSSVSPDCRYFVMALRDDNKNEELNIVSILNGNINYTIESKNFSTDVKLFPYCWLSSDNLMIHTTALSGGIFSIQGKRLIRAIDFGFDFGIRDKKIDAKTIAKQKQLSPHKKFVAVQYQKHDENIVYMRPVTTERDKTTISNSVFVSFSPNGEYALLLDDKNKPVIVITKDLYDNPKEITPMQIQSTMVTFNKEKEISNDVPPPRNYEYVPIANFKHISEIPDSVLANLYFKTIELGDSIGIQMHLMDNHGNYYYGASEPEWMHIWSALKVLYPDGKVRQLKNYEVLEFREETAPPTAIAIVLDHSGSMGNARTIKLQEAVGEFIRTKTKHDAIAILKYDQRVGIDVPLSNDMETLLKELEIIGQQGYGGTTALIDATNKAVLLLRENTDYSRKAVIVFTDGNENSSRIPKTDVLDKSLKSDINIYTIGLGEYISEHYLKSLSYLTKGSFHHIYGQESFDWIFKDIYKKMKNYYEIKFQTGVKGEHKAMIELTLDNNRKDTLIADFYNETGDKTKTTSGLPVRVIATDTAQNTDEINKLINGEIAEIIEKNAELKKLPYVEFIFDKTIIVDQYRKNIDSVYLYMKKNPKIKIELQGHTDFYGSDAYNIKLSQRRAEKVKQLLIDKGIDEKRIYIRYYGEKRPKDSRKTDDARARNRRVEFNVIQPTP